MVPAGSSPNPGITPAPSGSPGIDERDRTPHATSRARLDGSQMARFLHSLAGDADADLGASAPATIPGYRVHHLMKEGGEGRVHLGIEEKSGRRVAIKFLAGRAGIARAFLRHIDVLRQIDLPCVARLLDWGTMTSEAPGQERCYLIFEYIDGAMITEHCARHALDRRGLVELMARVADAVHAVHERAVLHRDLKPANILITTDGRPMLIDFGIAIAIGDDPSTTLTAPGTPIGSPAYMPPEQAVGDRTRYSTRSDVFALGATAYAVLTGATPHDTQGTTMDVLARVGSQPPREVRSIDPAFPRALAAVLEQAVAREPEKRYESAAAFAADLRRWLAGEPVLARGGDLGFMGLAVRTIRRHPVLVTASVCGMMIASTIAGLVLGREWIRSPSGMVIDEKERQVWLVAANGDRLHRWDGGGPQGIRSFGFLAGPVRTAAFSARHGLALVSRRLVTRTSPTESDGALCAYNASDPARPVWTRGVYGVDLVPPKEFTTLDGETFHCDLLAIAEVFEDTGHPGAEILAIHNHSSRSASCVRVYDAGGGVLFEVWHDGRLTSACWEPSTRRFMVAGVNCDHLIGESYPVVVLAIEPKLDASSQPARIIGPRSTPADGVAWYYAVMPQDAFARFPEQTIENLPRFAPDRRPYTRLNLHEATGLAAGYLRLGADGVVQGEPVVAARLLDEDDRRLIRSLHLTPLRPRIQPEAAPPIDR